MEANAAVKTMLGMKNKCYVNVKCILKLYESIFAFDPICLFQLPYYWEAGFDWGNSKDLLLSNATSISWLATIRKAV